MRWGARLGLIMFTLLWLALMATSWADAAEPEQGAGDSTATAGSQGANDDNYNFDWLDPDKKIYVLQNRKFRKGGKVMLSLLGGIGLSNAYRNSYNIEPRIAFYFNETWGIEGLYTSTTNKTNNTYEALLGTQAQTLPVVREVKSQAAALLHWAPWYSKINVFNSILYFDWYFTGGVGTVSTDAYVKKSNVLSSQSQNFTAFFVGTGQHYYLSQHFSIRLDVTGSYFQAPYKDLTGDKAWFPNYNLGLGIACRL